MDISIESNAVLTLQPLTMIVRRHWSDYRKGEFRLVDLDGVHWSDISGGVGAFSPRPFLHCYVYCTAMVSGELAHSCRHRPPPHRVKVCIVKKDNPKTTYAAALAMMEKSGVGKGV